MTPFRMRLFVVVFLALATAITINALYMQKAPHLAATATRPQAPTPETVSRSATTSTAALPKKQETDRVSGSTGATATVVEKHTNIEAFLNGTTQTGQSSQSAQSASNQPAQSRLPAQPEQPAKPVPERLVKAIQRELAERGYSVGPEIGRLDVTTRAAIIAFEFDEGMPLAGEASEAILKSLIFGQAIGKSGPGAAVRFERRRELVAEVQNKLSLMGYLSGQTDGRIDVRTRDAIRRFAADRHLGGNGQLNERVLLEMVIVSGMPLNANG